MKHAFGFSDRSGFMYPLKDLVQQFENGRPNGLWVGRDEVDEDHPQLRLGKVKTDDKPLKNPRPDKEIVESRAMWAWKPVGGGITQMGSRTVGLDINAEAGRVSVS